MKRAQAIALEMVSTRTAADLRRERTGTRGLAWILLAAEAGAAFALLSSDLVPAVVLRTLQVFLRF